MAGRAESPWRPLILPAHYDRHPTLRPAEIEALAAFILLPARSSSNGRLPDTLRARLLRLTAPLDDALGVVAPPPATAVWVRRYLICEMERRQLTLWSWSEGVWANTVGRVDADHRLTVLAVAYLLADQRRLYLAFPGSKRLRLAKRVLGEAAVNASIHRVREHLQGWEYSSTARIPEMVIALSEAMLRSGTPRLDDLGARGDVFEELLGGSRSLKRGTQQLMCVLERLGCLPAIPVPAHHVDADARCDFYVPKDSTRAQLLEAKANLQHMLVRIPLTEDEQAAVEDGEATVTRLLERLADVATPAGPTPRALGKPTSLLNIPLLPGRPSVPSGPLAGDVHT